MDTILRGLFVYFFLLVIFRVSGRRSLAQISTFDFILVLIISEAVQQAIIDDDNSITNAILLVVTLVGMDIVLGELQEKFPRIGRYISGSPVIVVRQGELLWERLIKERVDEADILAAARAQEGVSRMEEIDFAVIEQNGGISIMKKKQTD
ncbi:MAG TPA: YetF domain-containing protein [Longimicrobiales bacterium]|nr:YetF domain-containing protein [Longimicrobiales bacterium]